MSVHASRVAIRPERPGDEDVVSELTARAFAPMSYASGTESEIIVRLRSAGALTVSLVAEGPGGIVGHIALSPVRVSDGSPGWFGLGPVSVEPDLQRGGIGSTLIREALAVLGGIGARGCVLVGDPAFYGRFGFRSGDDLHYGEDVGNAFQALILAGPPAKGRVDFHPAFDEASGGTP